MDKILYLLKKIIPKSIFKTLQPVYHFFMSWFSTVVFRWPSNDLIVIGVTGTTGKTTSVYLIAKMLEQSGIKTGFTSTAMFNDGQKEWLNDKKMTMVGRFFTQRILRRMVKNDCRVAIVETTSEGIIQFRHKFINYDILVFTGIYPEHIDRHGSFDNYKNAKGRLFAHLKSCKDKYCNDDYKIIKSHTGFKKIGLNKIKKTICANGDDKEANYFLDFWADKKIVYTRTKKEIAQKYEVINYSDIRLDSGGTSFRAGENKINLQLLGEFNVANAMNAVSVGMALDLTIENIKYGLENIKGVAGRLEKINEGQNFTIIVDYAFEPGAVAKLYEAINLIPHNRIIHVLGSAGGGRDIARRPKLGALAGQNADIVIVTNEDPYDDDPEIIIDQVSLGAENAGKKLDENLFKISERREAIKKALELSQEKDLVIITGKGSEQAICIANGEKIPWDDRAIIRGLLSELIEKTKNNKKNEKKAQ
ncbi:Mur ligase family protein [Patescibacteria group bacterium]